ncbi:TonB-dependent receptor [Suttonella sp. R2A3]|uniref:TonB-dependent receptor n=1 Tax=Suttonella sp. R2A3 TaxID=2908648 RepID=UPI001F424F78|nr:TonB-dependent receptor [Suttonella sp. R2A3]UJF25229.1 TonB-dependent receptor [Suttonella sp. R2A3]
MNNNVFRGSTLVMLITGSGCLMVFPAAAQNTNDTEQLVKESLSEIEVMGRKLTQDEKGAEQVYSKNVSNVYVGQEYLERYRVDSAGDVLKGLNGVYNMNSRTAGSAITPNIRGIAGKGRIPVTIDGTEQTVDVWLNNYGVGDRNYVDPALFRSIAVEKSPAMTRGVKSGVGGSMTIRTIEAEDVIPEGDKWGFEIKTSFSGNSTENQNDLRKYLGWEDYRTLPGGATADGPGGGIDPFLYTKSPHSLILDSAEPPKQKNGSDNFKFGGDQSYLLSAAFKTDVVDGLAAYSYRSKGNYFAGKHGADAYMNNPIFGSITCSENGGTHDDCRTSASFVPNMAKMYSPGEEVFNSNTETNTLLLKNNWYLPNEQKIGLQYMNTNILFGEVNPFVTSYILNYSEGSRYSKIPPPPQVPNISSKIQTGTYKIDYEWQPENNKWINLQANAWHVRTDSERHQSGAMPLVVNKPDQLYDAWRWCNVRGKPSPERASIGQTCADIRNQYKTFYGIDWDENTTEAEIIKLSDANKPAPQYIPTDPASIKQMLEGMGLPATPSDIERTIKMAQAHNQDQYNKLSPNRYEVISGAQQSTNVTRSGFDISNRFLLHDNLAMTISADYQREKLEESTKIINSNDLFNMYGIVTGMAAAAGPRSAERYEWGTNISFDWQPTDRLEIQAGVRYQSFQGEDVALAAARKSRNPRYGGGGNGETTYIDGYNMGYKELLSDAELKDWRKVEEAERVFSASTPGTPEWTASAKALTESKQAHGKKWGYGTYYNSDTYRINITTADSYGDGGRTNPNPKAYYRSRAIYVPYHNKRLDISEVEKTFTPGFFDEKVSNVQGLSGSYYKHLIPTGSNPNSYETNKLRYTNGASASAYAGDARKPGHGYIQDIGGPEYQYIVKGLTEEQKWAIPPKLNHQAWSPMLAVTYHLSDNQRIFARYAQLTRFPSVYEIASSSEGVAKFDVPIKPGFVLKPERSTNWEIGYGFTFTPYWPQLRYGDVRLTYYSNTIKNVIDTSNDWAIYQYDKKTSKGLELQSRIDTGNYFASFGATYRLSQKMCDRQVAFLHDMYLRRAPQCVEGSFGKTRSYQALQPKYSLNLDVGTRLLDEKLELGMRGVYHSKVDNSGYDRLLKEGFGSMYDTTGKPYSWDSSLVIDAYGRYQINKNFAVNFGITNLTDRYYLDPMSSVAVPGPGRTFSVGFKGRF